METTAVYPNRIEDKEELKEKLSLSEEGNERENFFYHKNWICKGYNRIVFGDHGPYLEFELRHFRCNLIDKFGRNQSKLVMPEEKDAKFYYFWLNPIFNDEVLDLKVYWQIKPVTNLPNAPRREDGKKSNFNRQEGYADYKRGMYYVNPYDFDIE